MSLDFEARASEIGNPAMVARVDRPIGEANGLPRECYISPEALERERRDLFARGWTCIGRASDVPEPGDLKPVDFVGTPLLLARDGRGELRVFHNVCSHRGNILVAERCKAPGDGIRCPYHAWFYGFDGRLKGTPHIGGPGKHDVEGFDRSRHGLGAVRHAVWFDLVFVDLFGEAVDFVEHVRPLDERVRALLGPSGEGRLRRAGDSGEIDFELHTNWKLIIENFLESYHLPWIHPGLNSYSKLEDHYSYMVDEKFAGQGTTVYRPVYLDGQAFPSFDEWPEDKRAVAEYPALFPNVFLGVHVDHIYTVIIEPVSCELTRESMVIYYLDEAAADERWREARARAHDAWRAVFAEDVGVVEGMQRGRHSPAFGGGVFSPVMDTPTHYFHRWVARRLATNAGPAADDSLRAGRNATV